MGIVPTGGGGVVQLRDYKDSIVWQKSMSLVEDLPGIQPVTTR